MIRRLIITVIVANFLVMLAGVITTRDNVLPTTFAGNEIRIPSVSAHVEGVLELISGGIKKIPRDEPLGDNPWLYPNATVIDFGDLVYDSVEGYFTGEYFYTVLMTPVTSGRPFTISESGQSLIGTNGTIKDKAFLVIPDYQYLDETGNPRVPQGAMPAGANLKAPTTAVGTKVIYADPVGQARIIRGVIAISGPPAGEEKPINYQFGHNGATGVGLKQPYNDWDPADINTKPGDYTSGTVTFTLSLT